MNYAAPAYGVLVPVAAKTTAGVVKAVIVGAVIFLGALGIALGVGLGVGLNQGDSGPSGLTKPTVSCNASSEYCGCPTVAPSYSSRIINGNAAATSSWPWMVYLVIGSTRTCSGFLVNDTTIITAANCVYGVNINLIHAYIGITSHSDTTNLVVSNISNVYVNSNYIPPGTNYDIAQLVLTNAVNTNNTNIGFCCLSSSTSLPTVGTVGVVAGWGETSVGSLPSTSLQQALVQVQNPSTCGISSSSNQFCASYGTISTCPTDNGAPFMVVQNDTWVCAGVLTGGNSACYRKSVYSRITF
jgi:trypsin